MQLLPPHTWIEPCQYPRCALQMFDVLLKTIVPLFFELQDQIVRLLLQCFDEPMVLSQGAIGGQVSQCHVRALNRMLYNGMHTCHQCRELLTEFLFTLGDQFCRGRGGGCT